MLGEQWRLAICVANSIFGLTKVMPVYLFRIYPTEYVHMHVLIVTCI